MTHSGGPGATPEGNASWWTPERIISAWPGPPVGRKHTAVFHDELAFAERGKLVRQRSGQMKYDEKTLHGAMLVTHMAGVAVFAALSVLSVLAVEHHLRGLRRG